MPASTLTELINQPESNVFRRADIKRRQVSTGRYESSWQNISDFVLKWGSLDSSIDDTRLNRFRHSGLNLVVNNRGGQFNDETNASSLWLNFMPRYRSLVRIQAGYWYDSSGSRQELPTDTTQGIFVLTDEVEISGKTNEVVLNCSSLESIFDEVLARDIPSMNLTGTASGIIGRIRDHTDGSGVFIFREFITSTAWTIVTTTTNYVLDTLTSLDGLSCWDLMVQLAEAENFVLLINRTGGIEFRDRGARTTTSQFSFYGQGFGRQNIIKLNSEKEAVNKLYTYIRYKYLEPDTSTSFVTAGTTTSVNNTNTSWLYGQRKYEIENRLTSNTATAQNIVNSLFSEFSVVRKEIDIDCKMTPQIEVLDRIDVSYRSYSVNFNSLWDVMVWDTDRWSIEGQNFDYENKNMRILSRRLNLDDFSIKIKCREV